MNQLTQIRTRRGFLTAMLVLATSKVLADIKLFVTVAKLNGTNVARVTVIYPQGTFCSLEKSTKPLTNVTGAVWVPVMPDDFIARRRLTGNTEQYDFPTTRINGLVAIRASDYLNLTLKAGVSIHIGMAELVVRSNFLFEEKLFESLGFFVESIGGIKNQNGFYC